MASWVTSGIISQRWRVRSRKIAMTIKHKQEIHSYIQVTGRSELSRESRQLFNCVSLILSLFTVSPPPTHMTILTRYLSSNTRKQAHRWMPEAPFATKPIPPGLSWSQQDRAVRNIRRKRKRPSGPGERSNLAEVSQQPEVAKACAKPPDMHHI